MSGRRNGPSKRRGSSLACGCGQTSGLALDAAGQLVCAGCQYKEQQRELSHSGKRARRRAYVPEADGRPRMEDPAGSSGV
jgi:hypothetical protein